MVVKLKDSFVEVDKVIFNDLSISLYVFGMGGKLAPNGTSSKDIDLDVVSQRIQTIYPNKDKLNDSKTKIIEYIRSHNFEHHRDAFKQDLLEDIRVRTLGVNLSYDEFDRWVKNNSENELAKEYTSLVEKTKEIIKSISFKDGYLDLSFVDY